MSAPFWGEYARVQCLVEIGQARDGQLDALLNRHTDDRPFDLHDCRRRLKNLERNLPRKDRRRAALLKRHAARLDAPPAEPTVDSVTCRETSDLVRRAAGGEWALLAATINGDYASVAAGMGAAIGTLKSRVSRTREKLKLVLRRWKVAVSGEGRVAAGEDGLPPGAEQGL